MKNVKSIVSNTVNYSFKTPTGVQSQIGFILSPLFSGTAEENKAAMLKAFGSKEEVESFKNLLRKSLNVEKLTPETVAQLKADQEWLAKVTKDTVTEDAGLVNRNIAVYVAVLDYLADDIAAHPDTKRDAKGVVEFTSEIAYVENALLAEEPAAETPADLAVAAAAIAEANATTVEPAKSGRPAPVATAPVATPVAPKAEAPAPAPVEQVVETPAAQAPVAPENAPATPAQMGGNALLNSIAAALRQQAADLKMDREDIAVIEERFGAMKARYNSRTESFEGNLTAFLDAVQGANTPAELAEVVEENA